MTSFYDFEATDITGQEVSMETFKDCVVLVVNTASRCGFTPQFEGLEALYREYKDRGFTVLGFPCNQFGNQDPGDNAEISAYCQVNYGVTFPMFAKIEVNGEDAHPLYRWLKEQQKGMLGGRIKWNFTKFLINREGEAVGRYAPQTTPASLKKDIEALLG